MNLNSFIGNRKIISRLEKAIESNRFPHASLFYGKSGIGKRSLALVLAKYFNCTTPEGYSPCNSCISCNKIEREIHPDVVVIAPMKDKNNIVVEQIRELIKQAGYRPFEGKKRIFIIDDAERMSRESANSLLKTLEEPPESSYIFLVTSNIGKILPTIQSRCQQHRFTGISAEEIKNYLVRNKSFPAEEAHHVALLADGSIGKALDMNMDKVVARREELVKVLSSLLIESKHDAFVSSAENMPSDRMELKAVLEQLQGLFRDIAILITGSDLKLMMNKDLHKKLTELSQRFSLPEICEIIDEISRITGLLERNINPNTKGLCESIFLTIQKKASNT